MTWKGVSGNILKFTDDTRLFVRIREDYEGLQRNLIKLHVWATQW